VTVVYRCNGCGEITEIVTTGGYRPVLSGKAAIRWRVIPGVSCDDEDKAHLCDECVSEALVDFARGYTQPRVSG
jgi:hypothetical protein